LSGDLAGDLGVEAAKGVKGTGIAISLVLELPMGPRMARSIFFWANPNFRSANVLVFLTGEGFLSFSKGILTIRDFLTGVLTGEGFLSFSKGILTITFLGDFLGMGDLFFFFLPKGNLAMSFDLLGDFLLGDFFLGDFFLGKRIRSGDTRGGVWSGVWCGGGTRIRSGGTLFFFWVSHLNK
jgi:hypothetical protein